MRAGLGRGLVIQFHKASMSVFNDSMHEIDFKGSIGIRKVLLRRKKNLQWNPGLVFRILVSPQIIPLARSVPGAPPNPDLVQ